MPDDYVSFATVQFIRGAELTTHNLADGQTEALVGGPSSPRGDGSNEPERIAGRVSQFLLARKPALFCDDCIADRLGLSHRRQANRVTAVMANSAAFWRAVGACTACGKHKQVIRRA